MLLKTVVLLAAAYVASGSIGLSINNHGQGNVRDMGLHTAPRGRAKRSVDPPVELLIGPKLVKRDASPKGLSILRHAVVKRSPNGNPISLSIIRRARAVDGLYPGMSITRHSTVKRSADISPGTSWSRYERDAHPNIFLAKPQ